MAPSPTTALLALLLLAVATLLVGAQAIPPRPDFVGTARVKQHMHRTGDLVEGEEHLLKVIVKWDAIPNAEAYELCHNCSFIEESTGEESGEEREGKVIPIEVGGRNVCGGRPCHVMPGTERGNNKFHLRVKFGGEWSPWSRYQNFLVEEPGMFEHVEL